MRQYIDLLQNVLVNGRYKDNRTGMGTLSLFGTRMQFDISTSFPLLTTKEVNFDAVVAELFWFLSGSTNVNDLNSSIWDAWATPEGEVGPMYGAMWRNFNGVDQISDLVYNLKNNPNSRRHVVSAWNPEVLPFPDGDPQDNPELNRQVLAPCHCLFQFEVFDGKLSCQLYQRSADIFLGVPFNIASYALLTYMLAKQCDLKPDKLIWLGGDTHLYVNHINQAKLQISRPVRSSPRVIVAKYVKDIFSYIPMDIELQNYKSHAAIRGEIAV